jgi:hypothetical protein
MNAPIACPGCGSRLRVAADAAPEASHFTCPRCLAAVSNPEGEAARIGVTPRPEAAGPMRCPGCSDPVEANWWHCPRCGRYLREGSPQPSKSAGSEVDADVRLDQRGIGVGVFLLALLGTLTLVYMLFVAGFVIVGSPDGVLWCLVPLLFLLATHAVFYFGVPRTRGSVGGATVGMLATVGVVTALWFAFWIVFIALCFVGVIPDPFKG